MKREIVLLREGDRQILARKSAALLGDLIPDSKGENIIVDRVVHLDSEDLHDRGKPIALLGILNGPPEKIFVRFYNNENPTMAQAEKIVARFDEERIKEN